MLNFLTLYDSGYLDRGILLYKSLSEQCASPFKLYILALDAHVENYWQRHNDGNITVFNVADMTEIYPVLNRLKEERTNTEFCWTCSSFSIQFILRHYGLTHCIYVDADIFFYNDPRILLEDLGEHSVLITEHNYTPRYDKTETSGKFCVQFMYFNNNEFGNNVLEWWRLKCEESCVLLPQKGLFGDQKYLDDWESRFPGVVYNCKHIGCGVAPWNMQKYDLIIEEGSFWVEDRITGVRDKLVFFHFHALKEVANGAWYHSPYQMGTVFLEKIYLPYIKQLVLIHQTEEYQNHNLFTNSFEVLKLIRVFPVPFYGNGESEVVYRFHRTENVHTAEIKAYGGRAEAKIRFVIKHEGGNWIQVLEIVNALVIRKLFHEVLWKIQKEYMFQEINDLNEVVKRIITHYRDGKRIMTEIIDDDLDASCIDHPAVITKDIVRVYKNNDKIDYKDYPLEQVYIEKSLA